MVSLLAEAAQEVTSWTDVWTNALLTVVSGIVAYLGYKIQRWVKAKTGNEELAAQLELVNLAAQGAVEKVWRDVVKAAKENGMWGSKTAKLAREKAANEGEAFLQAHGLTIAKTVGQAGWDALVAKIVQERKNNAGVGADETKVMPIPQAKQPSTSTDAAGSVSAN